MASCSEGKRTKLDREAKISRDYESVSDDLFEDVQSDDEFKVFVVDSDNENDKNKEILEEESECQKDAANRSKQNPIYLNYLKLFIPDIVFDVIAKETNR